MQIKTYEWGPKSFSVPAHIVGETVRRITESDPDGKCTPQQLVEIARDESCLLHKLFTWNDDVAAENWRSHEARHVLNSLRVRVITPEKKEVYVPAFISGGHSEANKEYGSGYRPIGAVLSSDQLLQEELDTALSRLRAMQSRYAALKELAPVWRAVEQVSQEDVAAD